MTKPLQPLFIETCKILSRRDAINTKFMIIQQGHFLYAEDYSEQHIRELQKTGKAFRMWPIECETGTREQALADFIERRQLPESGEYILNLDEIIKTHILKVLNAVNFNIVKAANYLGLSRRQLMIRTDKYKIRHESWIKKTS